MLLERDPDHLDDVSRLDKEICNTKLATARQRVCIIARLATRHCLNNDLSDTNCQNKALGTYRILRSLSAMYVAVVVERIGNMRYRRS